MSLVGLDSATPSKGPTGPLALPKPVRKDDPPYPHHAVHDPCTNLTYLLGPKLGLLSLSRAGDVTRLLAPDALLNMGVRSANGMVPDGKGCLYIAADWRIEDKDDPAGSRHRVHQAALVRVFLPGVCGRKIASVALQALLPPQAGTTAGLALHYPTDTLYLAAEGGVYEWAENASGGVELRRLVHGRHRRIYGSDQDDEEEAEPEAAGAVGGDCILTA